jgi:hemerythrin-like domain-containing protein
MHHHIEEAYVFPVLAQKMPEFRAELGIDEDGERKSGKAELLTQHEAIHEGLVGFEAYVRACRDGKEELDWEVLRGKMESWGDVLWRHLDEEVHTLRAENMKKYWSIEEMWEILSF